MADKKTADVYDDGNIPDADLPQNISKNANTDAETDPIIYQVEPLPESSRPRKDGPGGA